ncbi:hypothetical protein F3Y22_tig00110557pilonHSYRG00304 [Hibiscus syriacus]|uniref:DUF3511 domain protein n=1 Tax=Hibiscus syriacus TaxID=106335 RepID=A0A6A3A8U9_HIBSY|nr:uncharacterized protein LOC120132190 [Hibiscus syriacus]KAE8700386.1 hypothetical protein F3Y22_tig00110557pilonHSYRG00304 [Hibiscus syriacus]
MFLPLPVKIKRSSTTKTNRSINPLGHLLLQEYISSRYSMEDYSRSRSYGNEMMEVDTHSGLPRPSASYDLRCYSAAQSQSQMANNYDNSGNKRDYKLKKGRTASASSSSNGWNFGDPEFQRKKRVASYKMYSVEGKVKGSLRRSFRWLKDKYTRVVYGW